MSVAGDAFDPNALSAAAALPKKAGRDVIFEVFMGLYVKRELREKQTLIDLTGVACALERFRLTNGVFPKQLEELVPEFCSELPVDVASGNPLKYRPIEPHSYKLYSVGKNGLDDGGVTTGSVSRDRQLDWVWLYAPAGEVASILELNRPAPGKERAP